MKTNHYNVGRNSFPTNTWKQCRILALALLMLFGIFAGRAVASCIDLDDVPLDTLEQAAPGIVMFVIDDSGSMDWEFICQGSTDGKFRGNIEYIFEDPGDMVYNGTSYLGYNGTILERTDYANYWQSQWAGHNRLYYDPAEYYAPWPTFDDAEWVGETRSNPSIAGNTLDLNETYYDFSEGGDSGEITDDRIRAAGGVIVDDSDEGGDELGPLIIDNTGPVGSRPGLGDASGNYSEADSPTTWTNRDNFEDRRYGSSYRLSLSDGRYIAKWTFTSLLAGDYDVYVRWAWHANRSTSVMYKVTDDSGIEYSKSFNQESAPNDIIVDERGWALLKADVYLDGTGTVLLDHTRDGDSDRCSADAVMLVPKFGVSLKTFEGTYNGGDWNQLWYTGSAYAHPGDSNYTHDGWQWDTGDYTATWTANYLDMDQGYDVYVRSPTYGNYYADSLEYQIMDDNAIIATSDPVSQRINNGDWVKIASDLTFSSGIGKVYLEHEATGNGSWVFADAVAFMPAVVYGPLNLIRAHYYTKVGNTAYLVNLDGGFQYYRVDDANNNGNIDSPSELIPIAPADAPAAIVTGRSYDEERQNFANWYSFYRKRELTAKNAIAKVIDEMQGVYIGMHFINNGTLASYAKPVKVDLGEEDADGNPVIYDDSSELFETLYDEQIGSQGTPLRNGLKNIGNYFKGLYGKPSTLPSTNFADNTYPYFTADKGGSCQQSFAIVMTDGYWNGGSPGLGDIDGDGASSDEGDETTLADVAMYYYENDLNSNLNDDVPINNVDHATHQHLVTYTLSFGVEGTIDQSLYPDCITGGQCPSTWPNPFDGNEQKIDDMYHAAVNGRGKYVDAASPREMVDAMNELKQDIESRLGSSASLATNSIQRQVGTVIYQGTYNTAGWTGEISALQVNLDGSIGSALWRASEHVPAWDQRNIISFNGTSSISFTYNNLSTQQQALLGNNGHDVEDLVNFIRGDTSNDVSNGGVFRNRSKLIGDVVHSAPTYYKDVVYIGANDGMLHAVDAATGSEIFTYVPNMVYGHLSDLAIPGYSHRYYVDSTPTVGRVNGKDILVCGLGKGGKGYFGLNVTSSDELSALWEYTGDDDLGYSFSEANIVNTNAGRAVVFGNGYDSVNESAVLFFLNPENGNVIKKIDTDSYGCNGLATPTVVDVDGDGYADYAYAGDLNGNMWKFDIRGDDTDEWKVYYNDGSPQPLIRAINLDGEVQPITTAPEVMLDCAQSGWAKGGAGLMVIFGTGRYLNSDDFGDISTQSLYGIWDWGDIWEKQSGGGDTGYAVAKTKFLGEIQSGRALSGAGVSGKTLLEQTVASTSGKWLTLSDNTVEWYNPDADTGEHMGWVFDLPVDGERSVRDPMLRMGVAVFVSVIPSSSPCDAGGSSVVYQVSACSGGRTEDPQFDVNGDGDIDDDDLINDLPPTGEEYDQMLFTPIEIGDRLYFSDSEGNINDMDVPPNLMGMQFWRVIQ